MRALDRGHGRLRLTDIGSPEFLSGDHGIAFDEAMRSIHGRTHDGRIVRGVEVFREAYAAVGLGWIWRPTRLPVIRRVIDAAYAGFARRRYRRRMKQSCAIGTRL